jgi:hypothetical protein
MKATLLLILMLMTNVVLASDKHNPLQPNLSAAATATAKASSDATAQGGGYVNIDEEKPAASSSPAASSNTTAECRYLDQWAAGIVLATFSKTKMLRDLVCTLGKPLNTEQKLALCIESGDYRELRYYISTKTAQPACEVGGSPQQIIGRTK